MRGENRLQKFTQTNILQMLQGHENPALTERLYPQEQM